MEVYGRNGRARASDDNTSMLELQSGNLREDGKDISVMYNDFNVADDAKGADENHDREKHYIGPLTLCFSYHAYAWIGPQVQQDRWCQVPCSRHDP